MRASPSCTRFGVYSSSRNEFPFRCWDAFLALALIFAAVTSAPVSAQTAGQNVNMVSGTGWTNGDPFLERQNEPSMAVSTRNSSHLFGAANDYRSVDLPGLLGIDERGDAWLGIYKSFDGGLTWQSTLLPGFPLDRSPEGLASPIHGRQAAADPLVRAGSNGLFFLTGIAFDRGSSPLSKVFISRFIDLNNKENGDAAAENGALTNLAPRDPMKYVDTRIIDTGSPTRFLDKPWVAVDIPRGRATCSITANEDGTSVTQKIPAGAIYVTYTAFTTVGTVQNSQILFRRSTDCGVTWSKPIVLSQADNRPSQQDAEGQGTVIAIDPSVPADQPARIYVAWRVFAEPGDPDDANQIRIAKSGDGGLTFDEQEPAVTFPLSCNKKPTGVGCPFDQSETGTSFRSNGYPALTVDNAGRIYLAWSQRDSYGDGRIMMAVTNSVEQWPKSNFTEIDSGPVYDDYGNPFGGISNRGSQLMPTLNFNAGKLMLTYYDLRQDHTSGALTPAPEPTCDPTVTPLCPIGNPFSELRQLEGELLTNPMAVFNAYIDDATLTVRRHTLDIIGSEGTPDSSPWHLDVPSFTHFRVSRYEYGVIPPGTDVQQAQFNAPNLPMFVQGTAPFMGDYIDVAGAPSMVPDNSSGNSERTRAEWDGGGGSSNSGGWKFNTSPTTNPVFHAAWTDNRDVQPPPDGVSWNKYTPPVSASIGPTSKFDPTQTPPACVAGYSGMRNQNIYTSAISHGLILTSPQTAKPVLQSNGQPIPREFSLVMRNDTNESRQFQLSIPAQPSSAQASFLQFSLQNTLTVNIPAFSSASRPVFLTPKANSTVSFPSFEVDATETDGAKPPLTASILFNADPTNPVLANPDNAAFGSGTISSQEFYNPAILNPAILNPAILNPAILNPAILNPAILNPAILNPAILNPAILNPNFVVALNPAILNPAILNPAILNNAVANPAILSPAILNTPVSDANYTITNEGNTSSTYQLQLFQSGSLPASAVFQIILTKTYLTPGVNPSDGCTYGGQVNNEVIASIDNPVFVTDPTQLGNPAILNPAITNPTFSIAPGDTMQVTLRANLTVPELANAVLPNLTPVVAAQAVNTVDVAKGITTPPISLVISTSALQDAVLGRAYSTTVAAMGGNPPVSADVWSVVGGALPPGLNLSAAGVISGTPTATGTFPFVVQVTDTGTPQHIASRQFSITVVDPVAITTPSPALPGGVVGDLYAETFTAAGGIPSYTWTSTGTLPPGLTLAPSGLLSGVPTTQGTFNFTVQVADSTIPAQIVALPFTIVIVPAGTGTGPAPLAFTSNAVPGVVVGRPYSQQLPVAGGTMPYTATLTRGTLPPGIALSNGGMLSGTASGPGTFTFTVSVTDSSVPTQTATQTITMTVSTLVITTTVLPNGIVGVPYSAPIATAGGTLPLSFSVANTAFPPGLTIQQPGSTGSVGMLMGKPTLVGTYRFAESAVDSSTTQQTATQNYVVTIAPAGTPAPANMAFVSQPQNSVGGQTLRGSPIVVKVTDSGNNPVAGTSVAVGFNGAPPCAAAVLGGTLSAVTDTTGQATFSNLSIDRGQLAYALLASTGSASAISQPFTVNGFCSTANLITGRADASATLLPNGTVLIAGGSSSTVGALATTEIYNPSSGTFAAGPNMNAARTLHQALLLPNGQVLILGGAAADGTPLASTEIFDPVTATFAEATAAMIAARVYPTATIIPLASGSFEVLIAGGSSQGALASAELYSPTTGTFTATSHSMTVPRYQSAAVLLPNGQVLLAGGVNGSGVPVATAEIYDPVADTFTGTSQNMTQARDRMAAKLLPNGKVLIAGGDPASIAGASSELYDPPSGSFSASGNLNVPRLRRFGEVLADGTFFITGGNDATGTQIASAEVYAPSSGTFSTTGGMTVARSDDADAVLAVGSVLVATGVNPSVVLNSAEIYYYGSAATAPLAITTASLPGAAQGQPYVQLLLEQGGVGTRTWTFAGGTLPPGITLSSSGVLQGTPTSAGTFSFTVQLVDSSTPQKSTTSSFTLAVTTPVPPLVFGPQTLPTAFIGTVYTSALTASGGTTPYSFAVTSGILPAGITLGSNGVFSGITGLPDTPPGSTFTITVTDSSTPPQTAPQTFTIRVVQPLTIATPTLSNGTVALGYGAMIISNGGTAPVSFAVTSGALPPGLALASIGPQSATLSGTPTAAGTFTFTITATDSSIPPALAAQAYTVNVASPAQIPAHVAFTVQPQSSIEGQLLTNSPIQVLVTDATSAPIANTSVSMVLTQTPPCSTATLGGTIPQITNASGVASFPDLNINRGQFGFSLLATATAGNATGASSLFNVEGYCGTASMAVARHSHQVIALSNGNVLVAGGAVNANGGGALASAELYNSATHTFSTVGSMSAARVDFTTTLLPNGKVLVTGGFNDTTVNSSAELFDPSTNTFTLLPNAMTTSRSEHVATLLANGTVLITGGNDVNGNTLASAEIFDPATNTFTAATHAMTAARQIHHADLIPNGLVLIEGGFDANSNALASAELYSPVAGTFTATGSMTTGRGNHSSTLLYNGQVLVAGGLSGPGTALAPTATAELYNPATGAFTPTASMSVARGHYTTVTLEDGTVFIQGGATLPAGTNADIFNPATGTFRVTGNFTTEQSGMREGPLPDGTVLLASGLNASTVVVPNSELFYPLTSPTAITITTSSLSHALVGQPYTQLLLQRGGGGALTWTLSSGSLPAGVTLSSAGILSGTPTVAGTFSFTVEVVDSGSPQKTATSGTLTLVVSSDLVFAPQTPPTAIMGAGYSDALVATGGTPPYTFAQTSGTLPAGITLSGAGLLTGSTTATGTFTVGVTVTDSSVPVQMASQTLTLLVVAPLVITTTTLPNGTQGTAYSATINTTGGQGTVSQSVTSGTLPTGLILSASGTLSGPPSGAGTFTFTVTATDQATPPQLASQFYSITIAPAVQVPGNVTFIGSPLNSTEGQVLTGSPLQVLVTDATSTPIPNASVSIGLNGAPPCAAATLGGTLTQTTDATGTATFPDLTISRGQFAYTLAATAGSVAGASSTFNVEGFCDTSSLATARVLHRSVALPNGSVLVAGGASATSATTILSSAEIYSPISHSFTATSMQSPRASFTMTVLQSGLVLIAGGIGTLPDCFDCAELFDPSTNTFTLMRADANLMTSGRTQHTATLLPNGKVLLTGGIDPIASTVLATAELFDPATNTFTATAGPMTAARSAHHADLLANGLVLITGGLGSGTNNVLSSAELYDPVANKFTAVGSMATPRFNHASAVLYTGQLLVAGGSTPSGPVDVSTATAEIYDPSAETFGSTGSATRPLTGFYNPIPVLGDGTVFIADGNANAEIYDPATGTFRATGSMTVTQLQPQTALLPDGTVLLAGGSDSTGTGVSNSEIFYPINIIPISITTVLPTALLNVSYTEQLQEKGGVGTLTWMITSGTLPAGLTLSTSGLLSGTPTTAGASLFTVQVTDSSSPPRTSTASFAVVVVPPITIIPFLPTANPGVAYSQPLLVGGGATPYTFTITAGALPAGLNLSNGVVSGTTSELGTFSFTVSVTDSSTPPVSVTQAVGISVAAPLSITTASLPGGTVGAPYSATVATSGGGGTVSVGLISGALPTGLTVSLQGVLSGTPNAAATFTFTLAAVDTSAEPQIAQQTYTVVIAPAVATLSLGPASLPAATVGVAYTQNFTVSGGVPPYTVTQTGALPTGLTFNGAANPPTITGTPTVVGTFANIVVTATDSLGAQAQITYSITVNALNASCGTGNESLLNGQYVILMQGFDANGPRTLIGSIAANGAGGIAAGQLDIGTDLPAGGGAAQHLSIIPAQSSFSVGADQRGCLVLSTSAGSSIYRFALAAVSNGVSNFGRIIDFQLNGAYGSGFIRLQNPAVLAAPSLSGSYALLFASPSSLANIGHWAMLGSFNASGGTVSSGSWDYNDTHTIDGGSTWPATGLQFPANESYTFDATGRGTIQLPSVQQFSQSSTLASANVVIYPLDTSEFFAAVIPDANNKPLAGDIQQQVTPFSSLTLNGAGYVNGVASAPIFAGGWVGLFSASQNAWNLSIDNDFAGVYSTSQSNGTLAVDSTGRAPLVFNGSTSPGPMVRVIGPNKVFFMLTDSTAAAGSVRSFPGGIPPSTVAGSYAFGSAQGSLDRKVTNLSGIAVFDSAGNVTFTQDQATESTATLTPGAVVASTYLYNAATGRGVIPATGPTHFVFDVTSVGSMYLLDVSSVNPQVQELNAIAPPSVILVPDPLNINVSSSGTMAVVLGTPAGANGQVVTLASSNTTVASVPANATVAAGTTGATFQVTTGTNSGSAVITATVAGLPPANAAVNVTLGTLTVSLPGPLLGVGRSFNATVTLDSPAGTSGVSVTMDSSDTTIATASPASVTIPQGGTTATFALNGIATGTVILTASAPGFQSTTTSLTITNSLISLQSGTVIVAPGQSGSVAVSLSGLAPTGGITINFSSGNTAIATITPSVFVPQGQEVPAANPQVTGVAIGTTVITASATGFAPDTAPVQVTVTASFSPAAISIPATRTNNITLNISAPAPQPNGVTFNLSSDNTNFVTVPATATIPAGQLSTTVPVTGVAQGSATLSATSGGVSTVTATINVGAAPTMNINVSTNLGQNLQVDNESVSLSASAPANENLTLTSNSANVLLAASPAGPFSRSITLPLAVNSFSVPSFSMQGLASSGTAQLTAQATGYGNGTATITLTPSGIVWLSGDLTTTTFSPSSNLTLAAYQLSPTTLAPQSSQNIRTGSSLTVTVTSSDTTVGTIVTSPVTINVDTNTTTVAFHPVAPGTTNLVIATPSGFSTPTGAGSTSLTVTVNNPNLGINTTTNLGQNLQVDNDSMSLGAAPPNNETLTLTSNSPNLLIASTPAGPFSQSITLALSQGSFSVPSFSVQGLASSGTAQLTASAPGYNNGTATINLTPSAIVWLSGNLNTTTFSSSSTLTMAAYQLSAATLVAQSSQNIRTGSSVSITVTSSDTTIGTIVTSPVVMSPDTNTTTVLFHPVAAGTANLLIGTPTGFTTPSGAGSNSISVTVTAPNLSINVNPSLGQNLQVDGVSISLGAAPPVNETLTLTSGSANVLIANTPAGPFSQTISLPLSQGNFSVPGFSMQGLASTGTAMLTVSGPGYNNGTATITLTPSAIEWLSGNFNTTTFSPNNTLTLASYQLNPTTLSAQTSQSIRTGIAVSIIVTSSAPTVGTIPNSPVTIAADTNTATVGFHPLTAGSTNLVIATPAGFTTPTGAGSNTITATVSAPNMSINVQTSLGQNLQVDGENISLGAAPPNNGNLTLSSSSAALLLATTPAGPFSQSITLPLSQGSFSVPGFSIQGLAASGSAQITAQAPGYTDATVTVALTPSAIEWLSGNFNTTTFTPNSTLTLAAYQLNPATLTAQASQNVRTGLPVSVTVTSSNTAVGTIVTSPVTLNADTNTTTIAFHPIAAGTANLVIATPTGFTTPNGVESNSISVTVSAPNLSINVTANLGQNLQVDGESISLGAAPPSSETLTLSSSLANVLLATTAAGPFSQSISLPLTAGSFAVPGFSIQGLASTGSAQLTASALGYNAGTVTINLTPSAIEWLSGSFTTTTFSPNPTLTLASYQLNPANLNAQTSQNIRTGLTVSVTVTTSDTAIGTIVGSPVTMTADTNTTTILFHPVAAGSANLLIATPAGFTTPNGPGSSSITATVSAPNLNINVSTNIGQNLQVDSESIGLGAAPTSSETLTLSSNSASLLLATTPAGPFSQSITLPLTSGSFSVPGFSVQGLANTGTAQLTASAPGYNNGTATATLTPSAIEWNSGSFSTTTFSTDATLSIAAYQLNPATLTAQTSQNVRTGLSVSVTVGSSDTTIGTILSSPVTINPDTNVTNVVFHPVAAGTANLVITTPAGFTSPNGPASSSITATVTAPNLSLSVVTNLGQNLQVDSESIGLGAAPPTSRTLTLTSGSAAVLLATTATGPFSQSITLPLTAGSFTVPGFSIQALAGSGTALLTASAPGYSNGTDTVTLTPSGIVWLSGSFSTSATSANTNLTVIAAQLSPTTLTAQAFQNIRAGSSVSVIVTSSDTTVGTIVTSPVSINAGADSNTVAFHPVAAGVTNLIITTPSGFTTPNGSGATSISAAVN